jgi:hypothetical protein
MTNLKQVAASTAADDEPILTEQELKRLAQLLNVLMEVDFYLNRSKQEHTDD